jgi:oligoribonuclease NrnB/cAMP/cGMP phosphodiesterase (DHH superfamily)
MNKDIYQIFTHKDLDGAVSLLTFLWSKPNSTVFYQEITNLEINIIKDYVKKTCNPPNILVFDMALREEMLPDLDYDYITFIDHHKSSEEHIQKFKQANIVYNNTTSNTLLIRNLLKEKSPPLTEEQKKMILYANDYDSGDFNYTESYDLNILFWTQFKNEFCYFCKYYENGFRPFTKNQLELIKNTKDIASDIEKNTKCFNGNVVIEGKIKKVTAAITEVYNNIVIDMLLTKYSPDILLYINTKTQKVSMRQKKSTDPIDLALFAKKYCDGNGNQHSAGGKITPLFMEFTKNLK